MKKVSIFMVCLIAVGIMLAGCGSGVSEDKPMAEVKAEAQAMDVNQLQAVVDKYKKAIEAKQPEIQKLQAKLKKIPISQIMGDEAKGIKEDISAVTDSIRALTDRMRVYASKLAKKQ